MKIERTSNMVYILEEFARNHNIVLQWRICLWGRWWRRRRPYSPSRRCACCFARWSGPRAQSAARGASGRRSGRRRRKSGWSRRVWKWSQGETLMDGMQMRWDSWTLEPWGACDNKVWRRNSALYVPCSLLVQVARVGVRVILVDVVCVMLVLIARVELHVVFVAIFCSVFVAIFL